MKSADLFQKLGGLMKKLALVIAAILTFVLPFAADAKAGRKTFSAKAEGVTAPELIVGPTIVVSGFPIQNHIDLQVVIGKDGRVTSYGPVGRWSDPELVTAAEKTVQERWWFKPATMTWRGGTTTPVRVRMVVRVPVG